MYTKSFDKVLKKYGFIADQKGILNRYLREKEQWEAHLTKTKNFILENLPDRCNRIAVLGSGWLLDFPNVELFNRDIKVDLFDLNHPKQIQHFVKRWKNVDTIQIDLTGNAIYEIAKSKDFCFDYFAKTLNNKTEDLKFQLRNYDLVISLNILSQLSKLIEENLLQKRGIQFHKPELRKLIQCNHLAMLPENKTLLITDYKENYFQAEELRKTEKLIYCEDFFINREIIKWKWNFDTHKMYNSQYKVSMEVMALCL